MLWVNKSPMKLMDQMISGDKCLIEPKVLGHKHCTTNIVESDSTFARQKKLQPNSNVFASHP